MTDVERIDNPTLAQREAFFAEGEQFYADARVVVRRATAADAVPLVTMACRFLAESSYRGQVTPNPEHQAKLVAYLVEHGLALIAEQDGHAIGMLGMALVPSPVSGDAVASEVCWWVDPEHRGGRVAMRMWDAAEVWARSVAAKWIQMIAPAGSDVGRWYARRGYSPLETVHQKAVA